MLSRLGSVLIVAAGAVGVGGCNGNNPSASSGRPPVMVIRTDEDNRTSQRAEIMQSLLNGAQVPDGDAAAYLQRLGKRIIQAAQVADPTGAAYAGNVEFELVRSPVPNVFTPGASRVYLYTGMLQVCRSEEDLAAVLAHGYAHVAARYANSLQLPMPAEVKGKEKTLVLEYEKAVGPEESREISIDAKAARYFVYAGYSPEKFTSFMEGKVSPVRLRNIDRVINELSQNPPERRSAFLDKKHMGAIRDRAAGAGQKKGGETAEQFLMVLPLCYPSMVTPEQSSMRAKAKRDLTTPSPDKNDRINQGPGFG